MTDLESRELDYQVATKVLKRRVRRCWTDWQGDKGYPSVEGVGTFDPEFAINRPIPHYTRDVQAAWEVVSGLDGEWSIVGHEGVGWEAKFYSSTGGMDAVVVRVSATADTAPLAICLTALRTVQDSDQ